MEQTIFKWFWIDVSDWTCLSLCKRPKCDWRELHMSINDARSAGTSHQASKHGYLKKELSSE